VTYPSRLQRQYSIFLSIFSFRWKWYIPVPLKDKNRYEITEIMLKVALNTLTLAHKRQYSVFIAGVSTMLEFPSKTYCNVLWTIVCFCILFFWPLYCRRVQRFSLPRWYLKMFLYSFYVYLACDIAVSMSSPKAIYYISFCFYFFQVALLYPILLQRQLTDLDLVLL